MQAEREQAVLIHLDGTPLPDSVYEQHDLATLEDELITAVERNHEGELDGNEIEATGATLFLYGPDANRLYRAIEPILHVNPLCQNARVTVRFGGPGASVSEFQIPKS